VRVKIGLTDGMVTEIEGDDLTEDLRVVIGEATQETTDVPNTERSPFTPQVGRGQRQGQTGSGSPGGER
jgi:hypothetical protein